MAEIPSLIYFLLFAKLFFHSRQQVGLWIPLAVVNDVLLSDNFKNIISKWLVPRVCKMKWILCSDCYPSKDGPIDLSRKKNKSRIMKPLLSKFFRTVCLNIGLVLFCVFINLDFVMIHYDPKKNLANNQQLWTLYLVVKEFRGNVLFIHLFICYKERMRKTCQISQELWKHG